MDSLEPDMIAVMKKRVYDVAGCNSELKVTKSSSLRLKPDLVKRKAFKDPQLPLLRETLPS
jgi:hypothetical protein